ncbi:IclR family transcriptional regulator [uncultured Litoreibacter sp.]|uniref:IclR family transcriptional regulator n=1 Tax=uncultured Litoreibacter sp. TaxID=1392394 RepID=UPI00261B2014|nr:IclR family transcriptional regulator [uncultured Litoreibacter sp.]
MTREGKGISASDKKSKVAVPAVEKALDVLELLARSPDGLTMNEIVDALGRTMGELYRVVVYLTERGFLQQSSDTSRYALTLKLFELAHTHDPTERLIAAGIPLLERIAAATRQSCHLGVLNRTNVLVLASVPSPLPAGYSVRTGALFPVDQTSSGHVILAFSKAETQDRYIGRLPKKEQTVVKARLERIRLNGFEDTPSTMIHGVRNLCVPVFDTRGVAAAITSGFIEQRDANADAQAALATIRMTALELSQSLGFLLDSSPFETPLTQ